MAQNLPRGTPGRVLVLLALLMGVVVVSAWRDALRREENTWVRHPSALGDTGLMAPGQPPVLLETGGKIFTLTPGSVPLHRRDDRMFRVMASAGAALPFSVFTTSETFAAGSDPKLYARTAPHQFLRLRATLQPPGTPAPAMLPAPAPPAAAGEERPVPKAIPVEEDEPVFPEEMPQKGTL